MAGRDREVQSGVTQERQQWLGRRRRTKRSPTTLRGCSPSTQRHRTAYWKRPTPADDLGPATTSGPATMPHDVGRSPLIAGASTSTSKLAIEPPARNPRTLAAASLWRLPNLRTRWAPVAWWPPLVHRARIDHLDFRPSCARAVVLHHRRDLARRDVTLDPVPRRAGR